MSKPNGILNDINSDAGAVVGDFPLPRNVPFRTTRYYDRIMACVLFTETATLMAVLSDPSSRVRG